MCNLNQNSIYGHNSFFFIYVFLGNLEHKSPNSSLNKNTQSCFFVYEIKQIYGICKKEKFVAHYLKWYTFYLKLDKLRKIDVLLLLREPFS